MFKKIVIGGVIGTLIIVGLIINYSNQRSSKGKLSIPLPEKEEIISYDITVQIIGEVNNPGIYELSVESRVYDLVLLAGGFTSNADTSINLVQKLKDGMIVTVKALEMKTNNKIVSINKADLQELVTIPSVGSSLANEIIAYRLHNGPFKRLNDLMQVKGISEKVLLTILPYISL